MEVDAWRLYLGEGYASLFTYRTHDAHPGRFDAPRSNSTFGQS